jgi:hypothetical protein
MPEDAAVPGHVTLAELPDLRDKTERVSEFFQKRVRRQLDALRLLLAPGRVFGRYVGGGWKEDVTGADETWTKLQEQYRSACGRPFGLQPELETSALESMDGRVELYPWEYPHEIAAQKERKSVTVTSPLRWLAMYRSSHSPAQLRQVLASPGERKAEPIRQFVVSALALNLLFEKNAGLVQLLADLRYRVEKEKVPGLGELPVTTIAAPISSLRPADELILSATRLSGVPAFIELIDPISVPQLPDPLKEEVQALLR